MKKRLDVRILIPISCIALLIVYACNKKFLTIAPTGSINPALLANKSGLDGLLIGAYSDLDGAGGNDGGYGSAASNWAYGNVAADDAYKGSTPSDQGDELPIEIWSANSSNSYPAQKWAMMYDGAQRANDVIRTYPLAKDITAADTLEYAAEARFLRGFYHFELKRMFKNVPYVDETVTYNNNNYNAPNVDASGNYIDIWPKIEADFTFAMNNLPATQAQPGRVNKYAAEAFLAKSYMYELKFAAAKALLDDLIANGETANGKKYALQKYYENNFNPDPSAKNSSESVFAVQSSVNDGSAAASNTQGLANGNFGDELNFPYNGGPGACCGFDSPSQDLANAFKVDANGLPLLDGSFQNYPNVSQPTGAYTGPLDPRIDLVMGRAGIPYLDWGNHPGDAWIRDTLNDGHFTPKKNDYASSQKGSESDASSSYWAAVQLTSNNVNLIRFADILLWDAECEIEVGSLSQAEVYVNMVRARAADPSGWVYKNADGTPAAFNATTFTYTITSTSKPADNYKISLYPAGAFSTQDYARKAVRMERRLELAMEGSRFFDLQRYDAENPGYMAAVLNNYAKQEAAFRPAYVGASFTQGKSEIFAIPINQIDIENAGGKTLLKQNPGY
jgi:hypothetical protein